ncbi:MAG: hypothetical protein ACAH83_14745 [Alphaproteobacteria bacterium]
MTGGYSQSEIEDVQAKWGLRFPPDLVELLREQRSPISSHDPGNSFDWVLTDAPAIQRRLDWPFEGFWFDVQNNNLWWPEWGKKPASLPEQRERLKEIFAAAPKLIPLYSHRYLPQEPFERENPVFSVYQADVIYYGVNLRDWIKHEAAPERPGELLSAYKVIPFWSLAEWRNDHETEPMPPRAVAETLRR